MNYIILLGTAVLLSACSSTTEPQIDLSKKYNHNHKPYMKLKFKRQQLRENYE